MQLGGSSFFLCRQFLRFLFGFCPLCCCRILRLCFFHEKCIFCFSEVGTCLVQRCSCLCLCGRGCRTCQCHFCLIDFGLGSLYCLVCRLDRRLCFCFSLHRLLIGWCLVVLCAISWMGEVSMRFLIMIVSTRLMPLKNIDHTLKLRKWLACILLEQGRDLILMFSRLFGRFGLLLTLMFIAILWRSGCCLVSRLVLRRLLLVLLRLLLFFSSLLLILCGLLWTTSLFVPCHLCLHLSIAHLVARHIVEEHGSVFGNQDPTNVGSIRIIREFQQFASIGNAKNT